MPRVSSLYIFIFISVITHGFLYVSASINLSFNRIQLEDVHYKTISVKLKSVDSSRINLNNVNNNSNKITEIKTSKKDNDQIKKKNPISIKETPEEKPMIKNKVVKNKKVISPKAERKPVINKSSKTHQEKLDANKKIEQTSPSINLRKSLKELDIDSLLEQQEKMEPTTEDYIFNPSLRKQLQSIPKASPSIIKPKNDYTYTDNQGNSVYVLDGMCYKTAQTESGVTQWYLPTRCSWSETTSEKMIRNMLENLEAQ